MRDIEPELLASMEDTARHIGGVIGTACRERGGFGFALMLFSFHGPEATWISNANRADMVKVLWEFISKLQQGTADEVSNPRGRG